MKTKKVSFLLHSRKRLLSLILAGLMVLSGCSVPGDQDPEKKNGAETDTEENTDYLRVTNEEPDTADPQCTDGCYAVPLNVFDRLAEVPETVVTLKADG